MISAEMHRYETSNHGTFSRMFIENWWCHFLEPPDRNNQEYISCIPAGEYLCEIISSKHFGKVYELKNVEGRTVVYIHTGNWAGDKLEGFRTDSEACLLPGMIRGSDRNNQLTVWRSRIAINHLYDITKKKPFKLTIRNIQFVEV